MVWRWEPHVTEQEKRDFYQIFIAEHESAREALKERLPELWEDARGFVEHNRSDILRQKRKEISGGRPA